MGHCRRSNLEYGREYPLPNQLAHWECQLSQWGPQLSNLSISSYKDAKGGTVINYYTCVVNVRTFWAELYTLNGLNCLLAVEVCF